MKKQSSLSHSFTLNTNHQPQDQVTVYNQKHRKKKSWFAELNAVSAINSSSIDNDYLTQLLKQTKEVGM